jgi:hypothetical protein
LCFRVLVLDLVCAEFLEVALLVAAGFSHNYNSRKDIWKVSVRTVEREAVKKSKNEQRDLGLATFSYIQYMDT